MPQIPRLKENHENPSRMLIRKNCLRTGWMNDEMMKPLLSDVSSSITYMIFYHLISCICFAWIIWFLSPTFESNATAHLSPRSSHGSWTPCVYKGPTWTKALVHPLTDSMVTMKHMKPGNLSGLKDSSSALPTFSQTHRSTQQFRPPVPWKSARLSWQHQGIPRDTTDTPRSHNFQAPSRWCARIFSGADLGVSESACQRFTIQHMAPCHKSKYFDIW